MEEQDFVGLRVGMSAAAPPPEQARPDASVDRLARFAAALCETPMAVVTVVAESRQWFKSVVGLRLCDTAESMAHSARTVEALETFIVNDVREGRIALDPGMPGPVRIRFYRGVPLVSPGGAPLGTLAVMDHVPRELSAFQAESLDLLAEQLSVQFELRRQHTLTERLMSERLRAVEASRKQARLLTAALDEVTDAFCVLDLDWRLTHANREFERLMRRPRSEILGQPVWDEFEEAVGTRFDLECHQAMAKRQPVAFEELCSLGMWLEIRIFPCAQGLTVYLRDVSERKRREDEQQVLEAQLRQAQKMESVGTLAGGIAHDFNNVLGAVLANVALASGDIGPGHPAQEHLSLIHSASLRAAHLVQKILAFSRCQPHELKVQPLQPLADEAVSLLRSTLPARVDLQTRFAPAPLYVNADATQIQQVLMNLCTNAWQALNDDAGTITVGIEAATLADESLPLRGDAVHLWVRDSGRGMDHATIARLFEPFFTTKPDGTGLGLAVVHGIVSTHGGAITVNSAPDLGTTFHLYLPVAAAPLRTDSPAGPGAGEAKAGSGQHIVVLDDDPVILLTMERSLARFGYRVTCRLDADAALAALAGQSDCVLLITDYNMPQRSGLEVARSAKALRPDLPVIITSGYIDDELRDGAHALGVERLLRKEHLFDELAPMVAGILMPEKAEQPAS